MGETRLTISVDGEQASVKTGACTGAELLDAAAMVIAASVRAVEAVWRSAGHGDASAINAGQCAIDRAGRLLLAKKTKFIDGRIEVRTQ